MKTAVIGLGLMGAEAALRLHRQGIGVVGWNPRAQSCDRRAPRPRCPGPGRGARWRALVAWVPLLAGALASAGAAPAPEVLGPVDLQRWVSTLWQPVASVGGLLNPDDFEDAVVVLYRHDEIPGDLALPVGSRALAIFELRPNGTYVRKALAEGILPCAQCMGTIGRDPEGAPFDIDIEDRKLSIGWIANADGMVAVRLTVAWDASRKAYALIGDDVARQDPQSGFKTRRIRDFVAGREIQDDEERAIEPRFIPIEEVSAVDYR